MKRNLFCQSESQLFGSPWWHWLARRHNFMGSKSVFVAVSLLNFCLPLFLHRGTLTFFLKTLVMYGKFDVTLKASEYKKKTTWWTFFLEDGKDQSFITGCCCLDLRLGDSSVPCHGPIWALEMFSRLLPSGSKVGGCFCTPHAVWSVFWRCYPGHCHPVLRLGNASAHLLTVLWGPFPGHCCLDLRPGDASAPPLAWSGLENASGAQIGPKGVCRSIP